MSSNTKTPIFSYKSTRTLLLILSFMIGLSSWLINDHYPPWLSFYNEFSAFTSLWLLLLFFAISSPQKLELPVWIIALVSLSLIPIAQALFGHIYFMGDGIISALYLLALGIACWLGFLLNNQHSSAITLGICYLLLTGALISFTIEIYQWLRQDEWGFWINSASSQRPGANLAQPNHLATLLLFGLASATYLKLKHHIGKTIWLILAIILIFGISLTQSRTAWLSCTFLIGWWFLRPRPLKTQKYKKIPLGILICACLAILWPVINSISPIIRNDIIDPGSRPAMWMGLLTAIAKEPWLGYGWNQVSVAHATTARDYPLPELVSHSHNIWLDLLIWNGLPLGVLIILGSSFWLTSRLLKIKTPDGWFAYSIIGLLLVHSMFEYPFEYAYFLLPAGLLIGASEAEVTKSKSIALPRNSIWAVTAIFALMLVIIANDYRIAEHHYRLARFESKNIGHKKFPEDAMKLLILTQLNADIRLMRTKITNDMEPERLDSMRKAAYRYPYISNLFRYALALAINEQEHAAAKEIARLRDLYGNHAYQNAKDNLRILAETKYPSLQQFITNLNSP